MWGFGGGGGARPSSADSPGLSALAGHCQHLIALQSTDSRDVAAVKRHVNAIVVLLLEAEAKDPDVGVHDSAFEYFVQHRMMNTLCELALPHNPTATIQVISMRAMNRLLRSLQAPLLPHMTVHVPLVHLVQRWSAWLQDADHVPDARTIVAFHDLLRTLLQLIQRNNLLAELFIVVPSTEDGAAASGDGVEARVSDAAVSAFGEPQHVYVMLPALVALLRVTSDVEAVRDTLALCISSANASALAAILAARFHMWLLSELRRLWMMLPRTYEGPHHLECPALCEWKAMCLFANELAGDNAGNVFGRDLVALLRDSFFGPAFRRALGNGSQDDDTEYQEDGKAGSDDGDGGEGGDGDGDGDKRPHTGAKSCEVAAATHHVTHLISALAKYRLQAIVEGTPEGVATASPLLSVILVVLLGQDATLTGDTHDGGGGGGGGGDGLATEAHVEGGGTPSSVGMNASQPGHAFDFRSLLVQRIAGTDDALACTSLSLVDAILRLASPGPTLSLLGGVSSLGWASCLTPDGVPSQEPNRAGAGASLHVLWATLGQSEATDPLIRERQAAGVAPPRCHVSMSTLPSWAWTGGDVPDAYVAYAVAQVRMARRSWQADAAGIGTRALEDTSDVKQGEGGEGIAVTTNMLSALAAGLGVGLLGFSLERMLLHTSVVSLFMTLPAPCYAGSVLCWAGLPTAAWPFASRSAQEQLSLLGQAVNDDVLARGRLEWDADCRRLRTRLGQGGSQGGAFQATREDQLVLATIVQEECLKELAAIVRSASAFDHE